MNRRAFGKSLILGCGALAGCARVRERGGSGIRISPFSADVTVPIGYPLMGGGIAPAREIITPLTARGFVLTGPFQPVLFVSIDWCEIRNDSFLALQSKLASAANTTPDRVLISAVHVHDAPVMDIGAQQYLQQANAKGAVCDLEFHAAAIDKIAAAVAVASSRAVAVTHISSGFAPVSRIASNRRFETPDGRISFGRTSSTTDPAAAQAPEGLIDPMLRQVGFWNGSDLLLSLSTYATHPMSSYGRGLVSWDFVGDARQKMEEHFPGAAHLYASGCSGNVTAGKYNDGAPSRRAELAGRLFEAMKSAALSAEKHRLRRVGFRSVDLFLPARQDGHFHPAELQKRLENGPRPFDQCLAALGLSWQARVAAGTPIRLPAVDLGPVVLCLLPAESYVEFQLLAQQLRPGQNVLCCGYGECGPGYIPTEKAWLERDSNLHDWCWVAPGAAAVYETALQKLLTARIFA